MEVIGYKKVELDTINNRDLNIKLESPITLWIYSNGKKSYAEYPSLGIFSNGTNPEEVIEDFKSEFAFLYRNYALEKEEFLTNDAIELKNKLIGMTKYASI